MARGISSNPVLSFNAGEWSPRLSARMDLDKYGSACRTLQNAVVDAYGPATRRAGTQYIASAKVAGTKARLIRFNFSSTTNYVLEFGVGYMRFYSNGAQVTLDMTVAASAFVNTTAYAVGEYVSRPGPTRYYRCIVEVPSLFPSANPNPESDPGRWQLVSASPISEVPAPWEESELFELQTAQINDVVYITHPNHAPRKLSRLEANVFTLEEVVPYYPTLLDENTDEARTLKLNDASLTTDWVTATAYVVGDVRDEGGVIYVCLVSHTSGTFATDLAAGRWEVYNLLTASVDMFEAGHVGSYWQLAHLREASFTGLDIVVPAAWLTATAYVVGDVRRESVTNYVCLTAHTSGVFATDLAAGRWAISEADQTSVNIPVQGKWNVRTYGVWVADILVQRSLDGGTTWESIRKLSGKEDRNVDMEGDQLEDALFRLVLNDIDEPVTPGATTPRVVIEVVDAYVYGLVKVLGVIDSVNARVEIVDETLSDAATHYWAEGAWSDARGFPRAVTLHEQRLVFGGTTHQRQTFWGSVTGDFENFKRGTKDTDSFAYTLGATDFNGILWFISQTDLMIGTTGGEWAVSGGDNNTPITPSTVKADRHTEHGSEAVSPLVMNDRVIFVQSKGRRVRELSFSFEQDGYVAPDLTILAEHVTKGGVVQTAYQQQANSILWAVTGEGVLIGLTYEPGQNVIAWHRHVTEGLFESVAVVPGDEDDEVWAIVKRTVGGAVVRYVERINPERWTEKEDAFYVDCGKTVTLSPAGTAVTGLSHLEGMTVAVLADGAVEPDAVVSGGAITLANTSTTVQVGLPFTTLIKPMRIERDPQFGVAFGMTKQVQRLVLRFIDTLGAQYGDGVNAYMTLPFRSTEDEMDDSPPLFTGDEEVDFPGEFATEGDVVIKQAQPLPLTLVAVVMKYKITGQ